MTATLPSPRRIAGALAGGRGGAASPSCAGVLRCESAGLGWPPNVQTPCAGLPRRFQRGACAGAWDGADAGGDCCPRRGPRIHVGPSPGAMGEHEERPLRLACHRALLRPRRKANARGNRQDAVPRTWLEPIPFAAMVLALPWDSGRPHGDAVGRQGLPEHSTAVWRCGSFTCIVGSGTELEINPEPNRDGRNCPTGLGPCAKRMERVRPPDCPKCERDGRFLRGGVASRRQVRCPGDDDLAARERYQRRTHHAAADRGGQISTKAKTYPLGLPRAKPNPRFRPDIPSKGAAIFPSHQPLRVVCE